MDKEKDKKAYAHAEKAYMQGTMFPFIKVGMQKVNLTPTVNIVDGEKVMTPNALYIYMIQAGLSAILISRLT